ncbi:hypothetical protein ACFYWP_09490 [Actinacidiphila glaucinigra]|uniref:hypothetical protein n=1 Tax=Actinacidiphila glaucinigra TaxID=235986 RepID=UPI0036A56B87
MKLRMRTLRIGDAEFRWTAELCNYVDGTDCYRCVRIRIWGGGKNGQVLRVDLVSTSDAGPWGHCTNGAYPTPGAVRKVVDHALAIGWDPATVGGRFLLTETAELEIPGFEVTDRLQIMQHLTG